MIKDTGRSERNTGIWGRATCRKIQEKYRDNHGDTISFGGNTGRSGGDTGKAEGNHC
jgi:hypothetical protein